MLELGREEWMPLAHVYPNYVAGETDSDHENVADFSQFIQ